MAKPRANAARTPTTTSTFVADPHVRYRLRVLLYDFSHVSENPLSQTRLSKTTDPLYISGPYFTESEATFIKEAIVGTCTENDTNLARGRGSSAHLSDAQLTVQDMIQAQLANFFDKRRASGDSRPCGPHDLAPIYEEVFAINRAELEEEGFLRRLRKHGLRTSEEVLSEKTLDGQPSEGKGIQRKKKGRKANKSR